jgi:leader peptidase (prepilin peptidase) / N-methyltransferase
MIVGALCAASGLLLGPTIVSVAARATRGACLFPARWWVPRMRGEAVACTVVIAVMLLLLNYRFDQASVRLAWSWYAVVGIQLILIDLACHRLPRSIVGAMFAGGVLLWGLDALRHGDPHALVRALSAAAIVSGAALLVALLVAPHLGAGDVTLAGTTSFFLGSSGGWPMVLLGLTMALVFAAVAAALLVLGRRIGPHDPIALGPAIIGSALIAAVMP